MKGEFYCHSCQVVYYIRATILQDDLTEEDPDDDLNAPPDLSADYCPFCGGVSEES